MNPLATGPGRNTFRPTVVCLHASGGTGAQWATLAESLRPEFTVLTPDLYGHGATAPWDGRPDEIVAADTERIAHIVATAPTDVHLVGHSYGATIALRLAARNPAHLASVAVFEPMPIRVLFDDDPSQPAAVEVAKVGGAITRAYEDDDHERAAALLVDYWSAGQWNRYPPERRAAIARRIPAIAGQFVALMADTLRLRDFANIAARVLYLTGRKTRASAWRVAQLLRGALSDVRQVALDGMGHLGPITHAPQVARRIGDFVRTQAAARATWQRKAA